MSKIPDTMFGITHNEVFWRDDTYEYKFVALGFSDNTVIVSLHDRGGFEKYCANGKMHPSENVTDTIRRMVDRIEDEYFGGK